MRIAKVYMDQYKIKSSGIRHIVHAGLKYHRKINQRIKAPVDIGIGSYEPFCGQSYNCNKCDNWHPNQSEHNELDKRNRITDR